MSFVRGRCSRQKSVADRYTALPCRSVSKTQWEVGFSVKRRKEDWGGERCVQLLYRKGIFYRAALSAFLLF